MSVNVSSYANSLAYVGVEANTPPNLIVVDRIPKPGDYIGYIQGTLWLYYAPGQPSALYILASLGYQSANWQEISFLGGTIVQFTTNIAGPVDTVGDIIQILGGSNISTTGIGPNTVQINLINSPSVSGTLTAAGSIGTTLGSLNLPFSTGAATGYITFGLNDTVTIPDATNNFFGVFSGNAAVIGAGGQYNTGIGALSLEHVSTGSLNTAAGYSALQAVTVGINNTVIGGGSGLALISGGSNTILGTAAAQLLNSGDANIIIGHSAGNSYTTNEGNNICIYDNGVAADNNTIRIGEVGTQTRFFAAGVYGIAQGGAPVSVTINALGQLGTAAGADAATSLALPATNAPYTAGVITQAGVNLFSSYGVNNLFFGKGSSSPVTGTLVGTDNVYFGPQNAANIALTTGVANTIIGSNSGPVITSGINNTSVGEASLLHITTGSSNTAIGFQALAQCVTGNYSTAIGTLAGFSNTLNDSSNIYIGDNVVGNAGDNHVLTIGAGTGAGQGEINVAKISGIYNITQAAPATNQTVTINSVGQLGSILLQGGLKSNVTAVPTVMTSNNSYIVTDAPDMTLPVASIVGDVVIVSWVNGGFGSASIAQTAGQYIQGPFATPAATPGVTTIGVTGSADFSVSSYASVTLTCVVANLGWQITSYTVTPTLF